MGAVNSFFEEGVMSKDINCTNIVLIPKQKGLELVAQFKPTSLCNFMYKIISRVMVNRIEPFLGVLILENQNAFMAGRQIYDNIMIA